MNLRCLLFALFLVAGAAANAQVAMFSASRTKVCNGSKVFLINTTIGANTYQWYVEDTLYSTSMHDSIIMQGDCWELQSIKLVAWNTVNGLSDTVEKIVEVFDTCALHMTGDMGNCIGDTIRRQAHPDAVASLWLIDPPHTFLSGCDTCNSIEFVLVAMGTSVKLHSTYEGGCSQNTSYHYSYCNPIGTGIAAAPIKKIILYPNPASDFVYIENKAEPLHKVMLYNQTGSLVYQHIGNTIQGIDISPLPAGLYYIKLCFAEYTIVEKINKL